MEYVRTFKSIYRIDEHLVGERATDIAVLAEKGYAAPLGFVVTNEAFEAFIVKANLQGRIGTLLQEKDAETAYAAIRELILHASMPEEVLREIAEAYEGVSIDSASPLSDLIASADAPAVSVILSTNYTLPPESMEGIVLGMRGLESVLLAIRECWACLFTSAMRLHRKQAGISERSLNTGVIVAQAMKGDLSAEAWSTAPSHSEEILVRAYYGALGPGIGADEWRMGREYLRPVFQSVGAQEEMMGRDEEGRFERVPIGERGKKQKLDDKEAIEAARLAKKAAMVIERPVKLVFDVEGERLTLVLCNRIASGKRYEEEERIEEVVLFSGTDEPPKVSELLTDTPAEEDESIFGDLEEDKGGIDPS